MWGVMKTLFFAGVDDAALVGITNDVDGASALMAGVGNPPRSKIKGRKKEKRFKKGMNAESKRKNKCSLCKKTDHNAARCPKKKRRCGVRTCGFGVDNLFR